MSQATVTIFLKVPAKAATRNAHIVAKQMATEVSKLSAKVTFSFDPGTLQPATMLTPEGVRVLNTQAVKDLRMPAGHESGKWIPKPGTVAKINYAQKNAVLELIFQDKKA